MDRATRPTLGWVLGWVVALMASTSSLFFTALFVAAFLKPHAFGGRDGQGAAGLAALLLMVSAAGALVGTVTLLVVSAKLKSRFGARWAWWTGVAGPLLAVAVGALLANVG